MHCKDRIKEMCEADALRFRNEAKQVPVTIETPWTARLDDLQGGLGVAIQELRPEPSSGVSVNERDYVGTMPLHIHDTDLAVGETPLTDAPGVSCSSRATWAM